MVFSSITFIYYFLPLVLGIYYIVPKRLKNLVLLFASIFFYTWGEGDRVIIFIIFILTGYILGLLIEKTRYSKLFLLLGVVISITFIGYFKYTDFIITNINVLFSTNIPLKKVVLPIGVSFYTFQILSYLIDVYRNDVRAQMNLIDFATYIALFPQLIAGPIVRYKDIEKELKDRKDDLGEGIRRFTAGLFKKVFIANQMGLLIDTFKASGDLSVLYYWLYAIAFSIQIYFDFSGYSDMAIGIGRMLGFNFLENFNYPYISKSITEFWRRWHMSLGSWFKDYVYIPLGGNRKHQFINILVVWGLTGLWHGASWNFVLWGLYFAIILIIEKRYLLKHLNGLWAHIYTLVIVMISFVIFDSAGLNEIVINLKSMFMLNDLPLVSVESIYMFKSYLLLMVIAIISATPLIKNIYAKYENTKLMSVIEPLVIVIVIMVCTAYLVDGSFNPFLYFRF